MKYVVGEPKTGRTYNTTAMGFVNDTDAETKVIISVTMPAMTSNDHIMTYKVMVRAQNAHCYVSAGYWMNLDASGRVNGTPRIVYTGINNNFVSICF